MDDWNIDDFNFDSEMDGQWNRHNEIEIYLTTYDGTQHLRLHGWLKSNQTTIKAEQFASKGDDHFGGFVVFINLETLELLKEENLESGLFMDLEIINDEIEENSFKPSTGLDNIMKLDEGIKSFLSDLASGTGLSSPEDIDHFVERANETTVLLFKKSPSYITEYIETNDMSCKSKIKDLDILIEYFEQQERYEDCALLVKVKQKLEKKELLLKIQGNE